MTCEWRETTWGDEISLEYGKRLRGYQDADGPIPVFGTNGQVGWTDEQLSDGPGIILGRKGAYRGIHYSKDPFFVIDTAYYVQPKSDLDMRWLYYSMTYHQLGSIDDGSPIPSTTRAAVYVQELRIPDKNTQTTIAKILGDLDDKIDLLRGMNRTLEGIARAVFRAWFVDFEPVRAKSTGATSFRGIPQELFDTLPESFESSAIGDIPKGWTTESLIEQAEWINGAAYKNMHFSEEPGALPVVKIAELKKGIRSNTKFTNTVLSDKYRIASGELLFSWSGSPETSIDVFIWGLGDAWLNQHVFVVRPNGKKKLGYLFALLKFLKPKFIAIAKNKQTTGLGHVTRADMKEIQVCEANKPIVDWFSAFGQGIYDRILNNLLEVETLAALRDSLLPKLVSGELEAPNMEALSLARSNDGG